MKIPGVPLRPGIARGPVALRSDDGVVTIPPGATVAASVLAARWAPPSPAPGDGDGWLGLVLERVTSPADALSVGGPPTVGGIGRELFVLGDSVELDGGAGTVDIPGVERIRVVTAILQRPDGRILLLRRSSAVSTFQGRWAGISGFLEEATPLEQALREVREEVGIPPSELGAPQTSAPIYARDGPRMFEVHPFRFRVERDVARLDREHTAAEWVDPGEIQRRDTVPRLWNVWEAVRPSPEAEAADRPKPV